MDPASLSVKDALAQLGLVDAGALDQARAALAEAGVLNPKKQRVSKDKLGRMQSQLEERFHMCCANAECRSRSQGRAVLAVQRHACSVCGGSNTQRAVEQALAACTQAGIGKVCVVGGSPAVREELARRMGRHFKLTLVDGTQSPDSHQARAHVRGHDVVMIAGASELDHKLSGVYEMWRAEGTIITVSRRGVEAMAEALGTHASRRQAASGR